MEYDLVPDPGQSVDLVRWADDTKQIAFDPLREEVSLADLAELADRPSSELLAWLSRWGLLGFRPVQPLSALLHPGLIMRIVPGAERWFGPDHRVVYGYEPLSLIREACKIAKAAVGLYAALRVPGIHEREARIAVLIRFDSSNRLGDELDTYVEQKHEGNGGQLTDRVGVGKHRRPGKPIEWDELALRCLGELTDGYLGSEFTLRWVGERRGRREIRLGWKVHSLLGALYLKLGYGFQKSRCEVCGAPIGHRRADATTCGPRCRRRKSRSRRGKSTIRN